MLASEVENSASETEDILGKVNSKLSSFLVAKELPLQLQEAIDYAVFPAGKRIRPLLSVLLALDLGASIEDVLEPASAIELIHCSSLIHDDLPALDNDEMRRGKPACHVAFSEATAVLAGDAMISLALELAASSGGERASEFSLILSRAYTDLCSGQQLDLLPEHQRGEILKIHRLKTGALFGAACAIAATGANLSNKECQLVKEFGEVLGTFFQVTDDYLDIYGDEAERGRPGGSDIRNQKETIFFSAEGGNPSEIIGSLNSKLDSLLYDINEIAVKQGSSTGLPRTRSIIQKIRDRLGPLPT